MNLAQYLATPESKYLVVGKSVWEQDDVAKSIAPDPRTFQLNGTEYVILSLDPFTVPQLDAYITAQGGQYEFGFEQGNGKASFMLHSQVLGLLAQLPPPEPEPLAEGE
jgi:hypothetical protein